MARTQPGGAQDHEFKEVAGDAVIDSSERLVLEDLRRVNLDITADLGSSRMLVREVLELKKGSVVPLDKMAGEMTDVYVNGLVLAKGEIVVIGDTLHVRLAEIVGASEILDARQETA